ncbi:hypothetical protein Hdeb2414_s0013g00409581 [Helianthus debilis subsp. tardiflorus]
MPGYPNPLLCGCTYDHNLYVKQKPYPLLPLRDLRLRQDPPRLSSISIFNNKKTCNIEHLLHRYRRTSFRLCGVDIQLPPSPIKLRRLMYTSINLRQLATRNSASFTPHTQFRHRTQDAID